MYQNADFLNLLTPHHNVCIVGMAKNAGKTTVLNYLIEAFYKQHTSLALTSIGRDGETLDVVTQTEKPRIYIHKGTFIATAEQLLPLCDITKEIVAVMDMPTALGRIVLVRALSDGYVQLAGPSMAAQMVSLFKSHPVDKILIDGALFRKSIANPAISDAVVLCTGAAVGKSIEKVVVQTAHQVNILTLPVAEHINEDCLYIDGALTDTLAQAQLRNWAKKTIICEDASKIFVSPHMLSLLKSASVVLNVQKAIKLAAICINPVAPTGINFPPAEFLTAMQAAVHIPVFNIGTAVHHVT